MVVHRDVRQSNLGLRVDGDSTRYIVLQVAGRTCPVRPDGCHGTLHTASNAVLGGLSRTATAADDGAALCTLRFLQSASPRYTRQRAVVKGARGRKGVRYEEWKVPGWEAKVTPGDVESPNLVGGGVSHMLVADT